MFGTCALITKRVQQTDGLAKSDLESIDITNIGTIVSPSGCYKQMHKISIPFTTYKNKKKIAKNN